MPPVGLHFTVCSGSLTSKRSGACDSETASSACLEQVPGQRERLMFSGQSSCEMPHLRKVGGEQVALVHRHGLEALGEAVLDDGLRGARKEP
jgi:hypothetical protein